MQRRGRAGGAWRTRVLALAALAGASPGLVAAPQLTAVPVVRLDDRHGDLDARSAVSLAVSEPLPLLDILTLLFRGTPFSVVVRDGVSGTFLGDLKDLTLRQALETVLFPSGLDYDVTGSVVRVFPHRQQTRFFEVDLPALRRDAPPPAADPFAELERGVRALLSETGRAHVDRRAGLVHVTDFAGRVDRVGVYLESALLRAARQVHLQLALLEVSSDAPLSIDWNALARRPGSGLDADGDPSAGFLVGDAAALAKSLAASGRVRQVAAPALLALNNEPAVVSVRASPVERVRFEVTPQISADGMVLLTVSPALLAVERGAEPVGEPDPSLVIETVVRVQSGRTVLVTGMLREGAAAAAAVGGRAAVPAYSELVVLLTPTVVTAAGSTTAGQR